MALKTLAMIPARGGSKGLPGKNLKPINGVPLICYTIDYVLGNQEYFDRMIVSTDDSSIKEVSLYSGIEVIDRPESIASDTASTFDVMIHALEVLQGKYHEQYDTIMVFPANVPLRKETLVKETMALVDLGADSVLSVTTVDRYHPYWMLQIHDGVVEQYVQFNELYRRQELPELYMHDGALSAVRTDVLYRTNGRLPLYKRMGDDVKIVYQDKMDTIDIDTLSDFLYAEFLIQSKNIQCSCWQNKESR